VLDRPLLEQLGVGLLGDAGHRGGGDLAPAAQDELGLADVVRVEIRRGKDVTRVGEVASEPRHVQRRDQLQELN
jgi:hypothetical protein